MCESAGATLSAHTLWPCLKAAPSFQHLRGRRAHSARHSRRGAAAWSRQGALPRQPVLPRPWPPVKPPLLRRRRAAAHALYPQLKVLHPRQRGPVALCSALPGDRPLAGERRGQPLGRRAPCSFSCAPSPVAQEFLRPAQRTGTSSAFEHQAQTTGSPDVSDCTYGAVKALLHSS